MLREKLLNLFIGGLFWNQSMPRKNALRVRINNKDWLSHRVKKDAVGGFWSDPFHFQEFSSQPFDGFFFHLRDFTFEFFKQKVHEGFQSAGFDPVEPRRSN